MVRHGDTVLSAEDRFAGVTDVKLSEKGREEARRLAERLKGDKISAVYASPLGRSLRPRGFLPRRMISKCKHATDSGKFHMAIGKG